MASHKEIEKYVNELKGPKRFSHLILWFSLAFIVAFFTWAYFATLDEVTHSDGKIIPSRKVQLIQNLEGGIVQDILVHEGEIVDKGQVLMELDKVRFSSEYKETEVKLFGMQVKYARLKALVYNKPFEVHPLLEAAVPQLVESERGLFLSKKNEMATLDENRDLIQKEIDMTIPLVKTGAVSEVEVLRLQQQLSDIKGKIHTAHSQNLDQLNKTKSEMDGLMASAQKYQDKLERTTVRSPVKGIVKQLHVNTVGGVIQSGDSLVEIVPLDDTLRVEVRVKPRDIGFIHPGQKAKVKISAYDFSIYGGLDGKVEHISADTTVDENSSDRKTFYEIWVRTDKNYLEKNQKQLRIMPGMTATVDILTGEKTVFEYLMKPILKAKQTALRER